MDEMNQVPNPTPNALQPMALPNSTAALVLGIISIVCFCCCNFVGVVLGIIGIVLGNKAAELYRQSPGLYTESSYKNANAGKICSIIGLVLCAATVSLMIAFWTPYITMLKGLLEQYGL